MWSVGRVLAHELTVHLEDAVRGEAAAAQKVVHLVAAQPPALTVAHRWRIDVTRAAGQVHAVFAISSRLGRELDSRLDGREFDSRPPRLILERVIVFERATTSLFRQATQANSAFYPQWDGK